MEGLTKRVWALGALVLVFGAVNVLVPPPKNTEIDEKKMEALAPNRVQSFNFVASPENPAQSYRMGEETYKTLDPSGIVSRIYTKGGQTFDVVLIASGSSKSFHDPRVCFTASGWNIVKEREAIVKTRTRGDVPMTFVKMNGGGQLERSALYGYRGPNGFVAAARKMRWDMFVGQLINIRNDQGVFYRFIPATNDVTDEELLNFAGEYLDAANEASDGFF